MTKQVFCFFTKTVRRIMFRLFLSYLKIFKPKKVFHFDAFNIWLDCRYPSEIDIAIGQYEQDVSNFLHRTIKQGDIIIDVGANIGYITCIAASLAGDSGRVFAFEPDPRSYERLLTNVRLNNFKNVSSQQIALGNVSKTVPLYMSSRDLGWSSTTKGLRDTSGWGKNFNNEITCSMILLDYFVSEHRTEFNKPVKCLKVDVEGGEYNVLLGAGKLFSSCGVDYVLVEYNPLTLHSANITKDQLFNLLREFGYIYIYRLTPTSYEPVSIEHLPFCNIVFSKYLIKHE